MIRCYCSRTVDNRVPDYRSQSNLLRNAIVQNIAIIHKTVNWLLTYFACITVMTSVPADTRTFTSRRIAYITESTNIMAITELTSVLSIAPISGFASFTLPSFGVTAEIKRHQKPKTIINRYNDGAKSISQTIQYFQRRYRAN